MKIFNNTKFKKILIMSVIAFAVITVLGSVFTTPTVYAEDSSGGILAWPIAKLLRWIANAIQDLLDMCFNITDPDKHMFVANIVYNELDQFKVNIFDSSGRTADTMLNDAIVDQIEKFYGYSRTLAIAASLIILIYVGIRIVTSTAAGDLTKYKSLLKDWLLSLVLVLMMHYIMSLVLFTCDQLTEMFKNLGGGSSTGFLDAVDSGLSADDAGKVIIYSIVKLGFIAVTFVFMLIYAKRAIMIAFLTIVAPLVGISYSVDKIKDGQSQILDKWMKEYIYTALVMPLDALLFSILGSMLLELLSSGNIFLSMALLVGYIPLRGWFTEFIGADKASHAMGAAAAGAVVGNILTKTASDSVKRKGDNGKSKTTNESGDNRLPGGGSGGSGGTGGASRTGLPGGGTGGAALLGGGSGGQSGPNPNHGGYTELPEGASNGQTAEPTSYNSPQSQSFSSKLAHKAGRGALNMAENTVARGYGLAKGAGKAALAMMLTGNAGLAMQQGLSGSSSGKRNMVGRMDGIEAGAKTAAVTAAGAAAGIAGGVAALKNTALGSDTKRGNMRQDDIAAIGARHDESVSNANKEYESSIARIDQYANMSDVEFQSLSDEERSDVMSAVRDTLGEEDYNLIHYGKDSAQGDLEAFQVASALGFEGASLNAAQIRDSAISDAQQQMYRETNETNSRYMNMSRRSVHKEYKSRVASAGQHAIEERRSSTARHSNEHQQKRIEKKAGKTARKNERRRLRGKNEE